MLLADIGNTRIHIYDGKEVTHLSHQEAIEQYGSQPLKYITVKHQLQAQLLGLHNWEDISSQITLPNAYVTMGIDRKALCLSYPDGIFVSAGSAITVDVVEGGVYQGGFLLPGIRAYLGAYAGISPALEVALLPDIERDRLPRGTQEGISFGIITSIKRLIETHQGGRQLYISGGDGAWLASLFEGAIYDERLIFRGMERILKGMTHA